MKNKKILILLMAIILLLPQKALGYSQYIGQAKAYYTHPVTGVIEDAGNNPGIGQGMTENVLHPQALLEEVDGRFFLTCRFHLKEYISGETFAVQNWGDQDFYAANYEVTAETSETKDYRFEVPSSSMIVRSSFFVGPMGRDVVFYFNVSNYVEGNTDFVPMDIQVSQSSPSGQEAHSSSQSPIEDRSKEEASAQSPRDQYLTGKQGQSSPVTKPQEGTSQNQEIQQGQSSGSSIIDSQPGTSFQPGEKIETQAVNEDYDPGDLGYDHGLLMRGSEELEFIFNLGDQQEENQLEPKDRAPMGPFTKAILYILLALFTLATLAFISVAVGLYIYRKYLERKVDAVNEKIYQD